MNMKNSSYKSHFIIFYSFILLSLFIIFKGKKYIHALEKLEANNIIILLYIKPDTFVSILFRFFLCSLFFFLNESSFFLTL